MMVRVTTKISPRLGIVRVVSDGGVVLLDPHVDVRDVPEILAR